MKRTDNSSVSLSSVIENTLKICLPARGSMYCTHEVKENEPDLSLILSAEEEDIWAFNDSGFTGGRIIYLLCPFLELQPHVAPLISWTLS